MPVTYVLVTTKPEGAKFFNQVSEENRLKAVNNSIWASSLPGFISQELVDTSDNVRTYTVIWDTIENYVRWSTQRKTRPFSIERTAYNLANGITFDYSEHIS
jgi:heme-degrading monooxygenase HmoA